MFITTDMIRFFGNHIFSKLENDKKYIFKNDYYWSIHIFDINGDEETVRNCSLGSLYDDISSLKQIISLYSCMTLFTLDQFCAVLLEVGSMNVEEPSKVVKQEFILSQRYLLSIMNRILKKFDLIGNASVEMTQTHTWIIPCDEMVTLGKNKPIPKMIDLRPEIEKLISIYDGKIPLEEFDIGMFYWCFKVYSYNLYYNTPNSRPWAGWCDLSDLLPKSK